MEIREILKNAALENKFRKNKVLETEDLNEIFEAASQHGIEDYLMEYVKNVVDEDALNKINDAQLKKSIIIKFKLKELKEIVSILENEKINFAIIKGFGTSYWMRTENINAKAYADYDILIEEKQLDYAKELLKKHGYMDLETPEKDFIRRHFVWHASPLKKDPFFIIELHHRFTQIYDEHCFNVVEALKNKNFVQFNGVCFPTLNLEDTIYLLALHLYQHEYKDITFQLRHNAEIVNIILTHMQEIDWEHFIHKVIENHAQFPVTYAFYHINLIYKNILDTYCIPEGVLEAIQPQNFIEKKDMLTHRHMFSDEMFGNWDFYTFHWRLKYGSDWKTGYEERLFGNVRDVTLRYYYLFFRHYADEKWEEECRKSGIEYKQNLFF